MIPYGRQDITQEDIDAVVSILKSDFLTQGPATPHFEQTVANYVGTPHAVAVNSATSALHIACQALGLGPGDWLWTSPITFVASANCGLYCGAQVDFVDIDPHTYNLCPHALERKLQQAEREGRLPKIVVPVHLCGQSCDMEAIHTLKDRYGFHVIEDASHAIGGRYQGLPIGNCRYSDITIFSFHPVKIVTTAEGGIALTQNPELARHMERLRSHGITRLPEEMTTSPDGPWYYQQTELGYNYRMTEIQAALGISQMRRLDAYIARRHAIARNYDQQLSNLPVVLPWQHPDSLSSFHLYPIQLQSGSVNRKRVFERLRAAGIGVNVHYIPVHTQPHYAKLGFQSGDFPKSEQYYARAISLPIYPGLSENQQNHVIATLCDALSDT